MYISTNVYVLYTYKVQDWRGRLVPRSLLSEGFSTDDWVGWGLVFKVLILKKWSIRELNWQREVLEPKYYHLDHSTSKNKENLCNLVFPKQKNDWRFLVGKFSDFSKSESSRKCPQNSSVETRNNQEKILSSFWDNPEKHVFLCFFFQKKKC